MEATAINHLIGVVYSFMRTFLPCTNSTASHQFQHVPSIPSIPSLNAGSFTASFDVPGLVPSTKWRARPLGTGAAVVMFELLEMCVNVLYSIIF